MRFLTTAVLVAYFALGAQGADITGQWSRSTPLLDGRVRETSLYAKAEGNLLTGYMSFDGENLPVVQGKITGQTISFEIVRDEFGNQSRTEYHGTINGDELVLHFIGWNGRPFTETLKRVSTAVPKALAPATKISLPAAASVPYDGLAKTPPMGWNSWNKFASEVSDQIVRQVADAIATNGMKDAGYLYVNIDDTWEGTRDAQGNIRPNSKFPDMKALADYVHAKGLKLGIYSSPGPRTCAGYEGSFQHEEQDAKTFARWGIDYLKYDWCSGSQVYNYHSMPAVYAKMGEALLHSGRPIVFSLCQYGVLDSPQWGAKVDGNLWRTTDDISDSWKSMSHIGFDLQLGLAKYAGPGHWNDPDMLEIGNGGMTETEYRTHMSLWSLLAAPLLAGNDLRSVAPETLKILTNKEVIAIDQDPLGKEATRVAKDGDREVWARPLSGGAYAVGLFNRGAATARVSVNWTDVGFHGRAAVRDLWANADRGQVADRFSTEVPSHGVVLLKLVPANQ